jgi:hypothetical protein
MDEQNTSATTHLEAQQAQEPQSANPPRLHTKRVLVAYMDDQEKRNLLLGRSPLPGEDLAQIEQSIAQYNTARTSRPRYVPTNPIVSEDNPILDKIRTRPDIINVFTPAGLSWRAVMIDLKQILSFQPIVRVDDLDERVMAASKDPDSLLQLCFPPNVQMEASFETSEQGHTIVTSSPNLTYVPAQLPAQIGGQPVPALAFVPQFNFNFLNVAHYQGRYFIRDGYHRTAGLLRNNAEPQVIIPCILVETQTLNQTGWRPGMIAEAVLLSDHPPYVSDFWDEAVSRDLLQKPKRRIFRMRLDLFEIDEF